MRTIWDIMDDLDKIVNPGNWAMGNLPESHAEDDKKAWEEVGKLHDELLKELGEIQSDVLHIMERIPT